MRRGCQGMRYEWEGDSKILMRVNTIGMECEGDSKGWEKEKEILKKALYEIFATFFRELTWTPDCQFSICMSQRKSVAKLQARDKNCRLGLLTSSLLLYDFCIVPPCWEKTTYKEGTEPKDSIDSALGMIAESSLSARNNSGEFTQR